MIKKIIISVLLIVVGYQGSAFYSIYNEKLALIESQSKLDLRKAYLNSEEFKLKNKSDLDALSKRMDLVSDKYAQQRLDLKKYIESFPKKMSVEEKLNKINEKRTSPEYDEVSKTYFNIESEIKTVNDRESILKNYIYKEQLSLDAKKDELTLKSKKNIFGIIWYLVN